MVLTNGTLKGKEETGQEAMKDEFGGFWIPLSGEISTKEEVLWARIQEANLVWREEFIFLLTESSLGPLLFPVTSLSTPRWRTAQDFAATDYSRCWTCLL